MKKRKKINKSRNEYKLDMYQERLKLKMKRQELQIRGDFYRLQHKYSPVTYATQLAWEAIADREALDLDDLNQEERIAIKQRQRRRAALLKRITDTFVNLFLMVEGYVSNAPNTTPPNVNDWNTNSDNSDASNDGSDTYVVGKDDQ